MLVKYVFSLIFIILFFPEVHLNAKNLELSNRVLRHESHQFPIYDAATIKNSASVSRIKLDTIILKSKKLDPPLATNETVYFVDSDDNQVIAEAVILLSSKNKKKAKAKFLRVHVDANRKQLTKAKVVRSIELLGLSEPSAHLVRFGLSTSYDSQKNRSLDFVFDSSLEPRISTMGLGAFVFFAFDLKSVPGNEVGLEFKSKASLPASLTLQQGTSLNETKAKISQTTQSLDLQISNKSVPFFSKVGLIIRALEKQSEIITIESSTPTEEAKTSEEFKSLLDGPRLALLLESTFTGSISAGLNIWVPVQKKWELATLDAQAPIEGSVNMLDLEACLNLRLTSWLRIAPTLAYHSIDFTDETNKKMRHFDEAVASVKIDFELKI